MTQFPQPVVTVLASLEWRLGHLLWHVLRDEWCSLTTDEQRVFGARFPAWVPPRPSLDYRHQPMMKEGAGRDFLLMHRHMIRSIDAMLLRHGEQPIVGWAAPPPPGDTDYPVKDDDSLPPSRYPSRSDRVWKELVDEYELLMQPSSLRNISLDVLGTSLEYRIHAAMHQRFGNLPSNGGPLRWPKWSVSNPVPDPVWLDAGYDTLLDPWSAHVHPWFWKIHGLIDTCITRWEAENGPDRGAPPWMGGMSHDHSHIHGGHEMMEAQALLKRNWGHLREESPRLATGGFFQVRELPKQRTVRE